MIFSSFSELHHYSWSTKFQQLIIGEANSLKSIAYQSLIQPEMKNYSSKAKYHLTVIALPFIFMVNFNLSSLLLKQKLDEMLS